MKKRILRFLVPMILLVFLVILTGCKADVVVEIYLSDLSDYAKGTVSQPVFTGTVEIELNSKDDYEKYKDTLTAILRKYFVSVGNVSYKTNETSTESKYVADVEINADSSKLLFFSLSKDKVLLLNFNKVAFQKLNSDLKDKDIYYETTADELSFRFILINDLKKNVDLEIVGPVYVNNEPCPYTKKYTLKNREKLNIVFPDILRDYLTQIGSAPLLKVSW
ncbi:MAG: hypothetical protein ACK40U_04875 [Fervidobacterium pennivorans]